MTLLAAAAAQATTTTTTTAAGTTTTTTTASGLAADPDAVLYAIPTSEPYNSPMPAVTPTYDGSGEAIHPKVIDFANVSSVTGDTWNGWRFWMAHTPFPNNEDEHENPSILVSNNGFYWQLPAGAPDPLYPWPGGIGFNSDTHLTYDPDTDEIILLFRQTLDRSAHIMYVARSGDGVTWPASPTALSVTYVDTETQTISPSLVRVASDDWRLFGLSYASKAMTMWTAPAAEGPWAGPFLTVGIGIGGPTWNWHSDVELIDGVFRTLIDRGPVYEGRPEGYRPSSSLDGMTWSTTTNDVMDLSAAPGWDSRELYRPCVTADPDDPTLYQVWYSGHRRKDDDTGNIWGTGYTKIPADRWPVAHALPTAGSGTAYRDVELAHSPALMWRLGADQLTTATEADLSGNSRTGTYEGRYVQNDSLSGDAGFASRIDRGIIWRGFEAWMPTDDFTASIVFKPVSVFGARTLLSLYGPNGGWALRSDGSRLDVVWNGTAVISVFGTVTADTTYHAAFTVDSGAAILYCDGVEIGTASVGSVDTTGARLAVGARWDGGAWVDMNSGAVEYAVIQPSVLTPAQVAASAAAAL